jgi:tetratricopeptide (TPR) repeat protein
MPDLDPAHRAEIGRELLDIGERPGLAVFALLGHHVMVQVHGPRGDHASMQQHVELLDALVRKYRWRQAQSIVTMHRGLIAHLRGELDRADALYTEAAALMYASGAVDAAGIITLAFLTVRLTQGRAGELEQQAGNAASAATDVMAELLALVVARQGQVARAREIRGRVAPVRRDFFHSLMLTMRGMLVVDLADPAEAGTVYADLLAYRGQIGGAGTGSYAAGPVDTVLGDLALLLGDRQRAVEHYRIALALAEHCGNAAWAAQARERLAGLLT